MKNVYLACMAMMLSLSVVFNSYADEFNRSDELSVVTGEDIDRIIYEGRYIAKCYAYHGDAEYLADAVEFVSYENKIIALEYTFSCAKNKNDDYYPVELYRQPTLIDFTVNDNKFKFNGSDDILRFTDNGEHIFVQMTKHDHDKYENLLKKRSESIPSDVKNELTEALSKNGFNYYVRVSENNTEINTFFSEGTPILVRTIPDKFISNAYKKIHLPCNANCLFQKVIWPYNLEFLLGKSPKSDLQCNNVVNDSKAILNSLKSLPKYIQNNCSIYGVKDDKKNVLGTKMIVVYPNHLDSSCSTYLPNVEVESYFLVSNTGEILLEKGFSATFRAKLIKKFPKAIEPEMVAIKGGTFKMGCVSSSSDCNKNEKPVHSVTLSPFFIGKYEVTFDEWDACVAAGGCTHYPVDKKESRGDRAVNNVSWNDVQEYIKWLNKETGKHYRLPSEAEWEYSARAGTTTVYSWGDSNIADAFSRNDIQESIKLLNKETGKHYRLPSEAEWGDYVRTGARAYAWYDKNAYDIGDKYAHSVGRKKANPWGLYDMHGNVYEWCQDVYEISPDELLAVFAGANTAVGYVNRGGSWRSPVESVRSASRNWNEPDHRGSDLGFRLVLPSGQ